MDTVRIPDRWDVIIILIQPGGSGSAFPKRRLTTLAIQKLLQRYCESHPDYRMYWSGEHWSPDTDHLIMRLQNDHVGASLLFVTIPSYRQVYHAAH